MKILTATILVWCILGSHGFSRANVGTRQDRVTITMGLPMSAGENGLSRRSSLMSIAATWATLMQLPQPASARLEAVDRPDLLPANAGLNVIQTEKILTPGQVKRMDAMLASLEKDTGFRVRVLCQKYPNTPGLAIRDYWDLGKEVRYHQPTEEFKCRHPCLFSHKCFLQGQKDDKYVVLVVDDFSGRGRCLWVSFS